MVRAGRLVGLAVGAWAAVVSAASPAHAENRPREVRGVGTGEAGVVGSADWRGEDFDGRTTADGERFDMYQLTAASAALPLGSYAAVTNLATGERVIVRINDRVAQGAGAVITLSFAAAHRLGVDNRTASKVAVAALGAAPAAATAEDASSQTQAAGDGASDLRLASLEAQLTRDPLEDVGGLRGMLRGRRMRRKLTVTWADDLPTPLSGL